jgi:membrane-bound lytic murein transglycosylase D
VQGTFFVEVPVHLNFSPMNKRTLSVINIAFGVVIGILITGSLAFTEYKKKEGKNTEPFVTYAPPAIPQSISFAGENVPIERWDVKERFDRELLYNYYNKANILYMMKLSNRYFPIISERLKANGIPDDFKYLCIAESNLLAGAVSRVGATGYWQFMDGTAPGYGLEVNSQVDFRRDIIKSTDAAAKYLKQAYQKFGNWTAAAASYNCGQGGYNGQATFQGTNNYYDLLLPEETNRYIFRILAFKHIMENAGSLGFELKNEDAYNEIPFRTVTVNSSISNLAQFAKSHGTTFKILRQMNPWIKGRTLNVTGGKTYTVKLPAQ